jgi:hypothetical protein
MQAAEGVRVVTHENLSIAVQVHVGNMHNTNNRLP